MLLGMLDGIYKAPDLNKGQKDGSKLWKKTTSSHMQKTKFFLWGVYYDRKVFAFVVLYFGASQT